jgi:hypothetical protein
VFSKPQFKDLLGAYGLVQLYTDQVPDRFYAPELRAKFGGSVARQEADAGVNRWFQLEAFGNEQLPLYVILEPRADGKVEVVGIYDEGKINNEAAFAEFLRGPLNATGGARAQAGK